MSTKQVTAIVGVLASLAVYGYSIITWQPPSEVMEGNAQTKQNLVEALAFGKEMQAELAISEKTLEDAVAAQPELMNSIEYATTSELIREIIATQKIFNSHINEVIKKTEERIINYEKLLLAGKEKRRRDYLDLESEIMRQEEELDTQALKTKVFVDKIADLKTRIDKEIIRLDTSE